MSDLNALVCAERACIESTLSYCVAESVCKLFDTHLMVENVALFYGGWISTRLM